MPPCGDHCRATIEHQGTRCLEFGILLCIGADEAEEIAINMDVTCPSCQTRYRIPDDVFGAGKRALQCSACHYVWVPEPPADPMAATRGAELGADTDRKQQWSDIGQMIQVVQAEGRRAREAQRAASAGDLSESAAGVAAQTQSVTDDPAMAQADRETVVSSPKELESATPADDVASVQSVEGSASADAPATMEDSPKIEEPAARSPSSERSGAFLTGFLLIAVLSSVLIVIYLLHPQIIQRFPSSEQPILSYVDMVDRGRLAISDWVSGLSGADTDGS